MSTNETVVVRSALDRINAGDLEGYLNLYAEDAALHYLPPGLPGDKAGARMFYSMVMSAFPDLQVNPIDFVTEGNWLVLRFGMTGTHNGDFMGVPASGNSFSVQGITILRFENGKCIERWSETNMFSLMMQIGAIPIPQGN